MFVPKSVFGHSFDTSEEEGMDCSAMGGKGIELIDVYPLERRLFQRVSLNTLLTLTNRTEENGIESTCIHWIYVFMCGIEWNQKLFCNTRMGWL